MILFVLAGKESLRFFRLCLYQGIQLQEIQSYEDGHFEFWVSRKEIYKLKKLRQKTRVSLKVKKREGLYFFVRKHKAIWVLPCLLIFFLGAYLYFSHRVLHIQISGNSYITKDAIISYLMEQQNGYLTPMKQIHPQELALELRQEFPEFIWVSCSRKDTTLYVQVKEGLYQKSPRYLKESEDGLCHSIVAQEDAHIVSIVTRTGTPCIKAGDEVKAGEVLVSGEEYIYDDNLQPKDVLYLPADADIVGEERITYEECFATSFDEKVENEACDTRRIYGVYINLQQFLMPKWRNIFKNKEKKDFVSVTEYCPLVIWDGYELPIGIIKKSEQEYVLEERTRSFDEAKELANLHFSYFLDDLEQNGVSIISKNVIIKKDGDMYVVGGSVIIQKQIGIESIQEGTAVIYEHE